MKILLKRRLIELNLFPSRLVNDDHIYYQRIGTRLYIFILIISLIILTLYSSIIKQTNYETVLNPIESDYTKLHEIYGNNLICHCTSLSISYESFISIEPVYHQICSSEFISSAWIDYLLENEIKSYFTADYIRINLGTQLNILRTLCEYSKQMTNDGLNAFFQTQFVSSQVISEEIFRIQINTLIQQWFIDALNRCQRVIDLVRATNQGNKFMNDYYNFKLEINNTFGQVNFVSIDYSNCSCDLDQTCSIPLFIGTSDDVFSTDSKNNTNSNFFIGCYAFEAILQATLECFYNRSCIDNILFMKNGDIDGYELFANISTLIITDNQSNETIASIVHRIMINSLLSNISFSSYYNKCHPQLCTIEKISRQNVFSIIMLVISVLGGLSTGLKILFLIGIKFFQKIKDVRQFFRKTFTCTNEYEITTRLHFILLIILMLIFYFITFLPSSLTTVQITEPNVSIYQDLSKQTSELVQCSCSQISFNYETFLNVQPYFHEICSSDFMSNEWIRYIYETNKQYSQLNYTDFRLSAVGQFQLLISFCQLSQRTIDESLSQLNVTAYIETQLVPLNVLDNIIQTTMKEFHLKTSKLFGTTLSILREITETNKLMSGYSTNWKYDNIDIDEYSSFLYTTSLSYEGCDCALSSKCTQSSRGMKVGCYPFEALLQSTLQCFYDQQCIDVNKNFKALNSSNVFSRFNITSTIEFIVQELMIENYSIVMSYENYFNQCAPSSCSYSYTGHHNAIDTIIMLIGLYGGLVIISRWLAFLVFQIYKCRIRQIHPVL
ncbi:unnamed protein product [Adineta steineri]|uniref:Uncharacterized protein n=1 Tax=Adineta steineri TaxID=433720 RepID=A0A814G2L3_9BILA|nr:unnamed protein product [Adineta steineri]CAF4066130.1 unnamed protein product [Adineta steineri]